MTSRLVEKYPLVSVITVTLNAVNCIDKTINSVINQSYPNIEYIILDGGSTDGTLDIVKEYSKFITSWQSEPDNGLFDAMNKGLKLAAGEYVNFMNAGDIFYSSEAIASLHLEKISSPTSICGINLYYSDYTSGLIKVLPSESSFPHQALFMARKDFEKYNFNTNLKYCADAELWTRFNAKNNQVIFIRKYISISSFGGMSTSRNYLFERMKENLQFRPNKLQVLVRFIPKIFVYTLLGDRLFEMLYFYLKINKLL